MKLVLFDCDGTIVDSQHVIVAAMNAAFAAVGLAPPNRRAVVAAVGLSLPRAIERLVPDAGAALIERLAEEYKSAFQALRDGPDHNEPLFPGALLAIKALAARPDVVLGIATGKSRRGVALLLERAQLSGHFETIQTADTHPSKPDPSMVRTAMAETGAGPGDAVLIGDTTYDMAMARAAGAQAIGVGWGYHPAQELRRAGAHAIVESYGALIPAIDGIFLKNAGAKP